MPHLKNFVQLSSLYINFLNLQLISDQSFAFFGLLTDGEIILVSPVHPVAEGHSVTLGCKLKTETVLSNVDFYKDGQLIQNGTKRELTIPAVSKSDEGFYKCKGKNSPHGSPESWMSVKCEYDKLSSGIFLEVV